MTDTFFLCGFAFLAGLIDSVAGGGGLIQLPALFIFFPQAPVASIVGTSKFSSIAGTSIAAAQYARLIDIDWKATLPAAVVALIFSLLGARTVSLIRTDLMRPLVLFLLVAIAIYTFTRKEFGSLHAPRLGHAAQFWVSIPVGMAVGFYDGFFGPGTGSFLMFIFIGLFGFSFLSASASAKFVNFATNLSATLYFAATGSILFAVALPMAACNILGSFIGTRMAVLKGSRFVRVFFLVVVSGMIIRLAFDTFHLGHYFALVR